MSSSSDESWVFILFYFFTLLAVLERLTVTTEPIILFGMVDSLAWFINACIWCLSERQIQMETLFFFRLQRCCFPSAELSYLLYLHLYECPMGAPVLAEHQYGLILASFTAMCDDECNECNDDINSSSCLLCNLLCWVGGEAYFGMLHCWDANLFKSSEWKYHVQVIFQEEAALHSYRLY